MSVRHELIAAWTGDYDKGKFLVPKHDGRDNAYVDWRHPRSVLELADNLSGFAQNSRWIQTQVGTRFTASGVLWMAATTTNEPKPLLITRFEGQESLQIRALKRTKADPRLSR